MANSESLSIKDLERVNATLAELVNIPKWTPAMGAMLICGILPVGAPFEIPDTNNSSLKSRTDLATKKDVDKSKLVLEDWIESYGERNDDERPQVVRNLVEPPVFLLWAMEYYEDDADWQKPSWLKYWISYCEWDYQSGAPSQVPRTLVHQAAALEHEMCLIKSGHIVGNSIALTKSASDLAYVEEMTASIRSRGRSPIAKYIILALQAAEDPRDLPTVWAHLCDIAKSKKPLVLKFISETKLDIPGHRASKSFTKENLGQYLRQHAASISAVAKAR
jgi:hypothetical protein